MIKPEQLNQLKKQFSHIFNIEENGNLTLKDGFDIPPFNLIFIQGGHFTMGKEPEQVKIELSPYFIAEFQVTQELYKSVTGVNPSHFEGINHPVEQLNWYDAINFCQQLNQKLKILPGTYKIDKDKHHQNNKIKVDELKWSVQFNERENGFRLPTEAEWEFAAVGTEIFNYAGSDELDVVGWNKRNSKSTCTVGLKFPNSRGIYDLSGNVWEWCWDWYSYYNKNKFINPLSEELGIHHILRGGSWTNQERECQIRNRSYNRSYILKNDIGMRLVFSIQFA